MQHRDVEAGAPCSDHSSVHTVVDRHDVSSIASSLRDIRFSGKVEGYGAEDEKKSAVSVKEESTAELDKYLVLFEKDDPEDPLNWSFTKKFIITAGAILMIFNSTLASSLPSGVILQLESYFGFSSETGAVVISLFVLGFLIGPILWGPLSEHYGRRPITLISMPLFVGTQIGCALSRNTASILIFRLLGGVFAAAPLTNSGAIMSDIVHPAFRGKVMAGFTVGPFAGPTVAPLVSGWMNVGGLSWRWAFWFQTILAGVCLAMSVFAQPETFKPVILANRAKRLRQETGDDRWWAPLEKQHKPFLQQAKAILSRPFVLLFAEPMLMAITFYMSFIYGVTYLLFEAYPIVFSIGHGFNSGVSGLMFLPIPIGGLTACALYVIYFDPIYQVAVREHHPIFPPPEYRLHTSLYGAVLLPIAFFWFSWTSYPSISYWAPMMAGFPLGTGIVLLYLGLFSYIIDTYLASAASALAATIIFRSLFGAVFPLFANQMFEKLTPRWAGSLLGFVAIAMAPMPFILRKYGPALRARSRGPAPSSY